MIQIQIANNDTKWIKTAVKFPVIALINLALTNQKLFFKRIKNIKFFAFKKHYWVFLTELHFWLCQRFKIIAKISGVLFINEQFSIRFISQPINEAFDEALPISWRGWWTLKNRKSEFSMAIAETVQIVRLNFTFLWYI